jgi:IclR family acetate operon transcriptional repressor
MSSSAMEDATAQHVRRTLRALELLATGPQTQADVARDLAVHRRTARRLLARIVEEGYAAPAQSGRHVAYRATSRLAVLGRQAAEGLDVVAIAQRHLAALDPDRVGVRFVALLDEEGVWMPHVERPDGGDPLGSADLLGGTRPLHATAAGKVFLSADAGLAGEVLNHELLVFTARTLATRADLLLELASAREQGFAVEDGEHHVDLRAAASGATNHVGRTVAALGATPAPQVELAELGGLVREAALACSRELGAPA